MPEAVCVNLPTTECFCGVYTPVALYDAPVVGSSVDLDSPSFIIPEALRIPITYSPTLQISGMVTEGWATSESLPGYHGSPKLYYALDLGVWILTYLDLALNTGLNKSSGVFMFYGYVNCVDGCDGLLYMDTCCSQVLYLECSGS